MSFWTIKGVVTRTIRHIMTDDDEWVEVRCFDTVPHCPITMGNVVELEPIIEVTPVIEAATIIDIVPVELPELPNIESFLRGEC